MSFLDWIKKMSYPAKTVFAFGIYLFLLGVVFLLVPNLLLNLLQMPPTSEVWSRVVGMLLTGIGIYYFVASLSELRIFIVWTIPLRLAVILFFGAFVIANLAPPVLMLLSVIDIAGALWTWSALRKGSGS
jgi:hypothetical protein